MADTIASTSWYALVFATLGFFVATYAAIVSHIPRLPEQRGLLAVILSAALVSLGATVATLLTQRQAANAGIYFLFSCLMVLGIAAALLDLVLFVQARRRGLAGANWSLYVALALLGCSALGLYSQYGGAG
jgi:drug/metabolite transporter (DMT)-like permease